MTKSDHRPRVASERRHQMRVRLLNAALDLVAVRGPMGVSIDDIIVRAEVSRGTFYKYFATPADLVREVALEISNEFLKIVDERVMEFTDPAQWVSAGIRLCLRIVRANPLFGSFISRLGWPNLSYDDHPSYLFLERDLRLGMLHGKFDRVPMHVGVNLVAGSLVGAIHTASSTAVTYHYPDLVAMCVLKGLGVEGTEAKSIASIKLAHPQLTLDGILFNVARNLDDVKALKSS
jgi:TetR/AcrR family transcriptional regulator, ethionamide resistance regulator